MIEIATIASAVAGIENIANKTNGDKCFAAMVMTTIVSAATIACISIKK